MPPSPEQASPNAFETAILETFARESPLLGLDVEHLRVKNRRFTGVGSYTDFLCEETGEHATVSLKAHILVPGVPNGMGAVLFYRGQRPECLETFTCGEEFWTGAFEGFSMG